VSIHLLLVMVSAIGEAPTRTLEIALSSLCQAMLLVVSVALGGALIGTVDRTVNVLFVVSHGAVISFPARSTNAGPVLACTISAAISGANLLFTTGPKEPRIACTQAVVAFSVVRAVQDTSSLATVRTCETEVTFTGHTRFADTMS